ncbi:MAG: Ig-like domain-containing protein, partial [Cyclobacteriaceae bacterium]
MEILLPTSGRRDHVACRSALLFLLIIGLLLTQPFAYAQPSWNQLGADIDGGTNDGLGGAMAMSADGSIVAVGAASANSLQGYVKVYQYNGSWMQLGATLPGSQAGDSFGSSVSLSADGTVLAIGASTSDANLGANSFAGYVSVYDYDATNGWQLRGSSITAQDAQENFGQSVSLSSDGNVLGIGVPGAAGGGSGRGTSRAYKWNSTAWLQVGADIDGDTDFETSGVSVSLVVSGTDTVMAIGSPVYTLGFDNEGRVRIYTRSGGSWGTPEILVGSAFDNLGTSVSLSDDATRLGVGAPHDLFSPGPYIGKVQVYELTTSWTLLGTAITSGIESDDFGKSVDISSDGSYVIIGAPGHVDTDNPGGRVEIWTYGTDWTQVGDAITGSAEFSMLGTSVTISSDGSIAGAGSPANDGTTANGYASIHEFGIIATNTPPVITSSQVFTVDENTSVGTAVSPGAVQATDANAGDELSSWTITGGTGANVFAINASTGIITVNSALDYETTTSYTLTLTVSDGTATSSPAEVIINIGDIDEVAPTVTITSSESNPTNANPIPITITFNESVTGLEASDIDVDGAGKGDLMGSGDSYTMDLTPSGDGTITVNINANVAQDLANNGNTAAEQFSIISDITPPQPFFWNGNLPGISLFTTPVNDQTLLVNIIFSEAMRDDVSDRLTLNDITIVGNVVGTGLSFTEGVSGNYYTLAIPLLDPSVNQEIEVTVEVDKVLDLAGNANIAKSVTISYDVTGPVVQSILTVGNSTTNASPIPVAITFDEKIAALTATDLEVTAGTVGTIQASENGLVYTVNIEPNGNGPVTVQLLEAAVEDLAGNTNAAASEVLQMVYDGTAPTAQITTQSATTTTSPIQATITFSETIDGLEAQDLTITNGTVANSISQVDARTYTANITPTVPDNLTTTAGVKVTIELRANRVRDIAGNGNIAATPVSIDFDNAAPTFILTDDIGQPIPSVRANFTANFYFSEAISGFANNDITVDNGTKSNFRSLNVLGTTVYKVDIAPNAGSQDVAITIRANAVTDAVGNGNAAKTFNVMVDNVGPTVVAISSALTSPTNVSPIPVTFTFSEEVNKNTFSADDLVAGNFIATAPTTVDNINFTTEISQIPNSPLTISLKEASVEDLAGNLNTNTGSFTIIYDNVPPTVTIAGPDAVNSTNAFTLTFTFSENVADFIIDDISIPTNNGAKSNFTGSNAVYTVDITPSGAGDISVNLAENVVTDLAGNDNAASAVKTITYDATRPIVTIAGAPTTTVNVKDAVTLTFTFSEAVTGFTVEDIAVPNGTKANFTGSGTVYTADITPAENGEVTVSLAESAAQDAAGNGNEAASISFIYEQKYSGGEGTLESPYLIGNNDDFKMMSERTNDWGAHFQQIADIDFDASKYPNGYQPIGTFSGSYDGGGHALDGFTMNSSNGDAAIFNQVVSNHFIKNWTLSNVSITAKSRAAALVVIINSSNLTISDVDVSGSITGAEESTAGFVSLLASSYLIMSGCINQAKITGGSYGAGLVGTNFGAASGPTAISIEISNCANHGNVTARSAGGLVCSVFGGSLDISTSYNTGSVFATNGDAAGIVAIILGPNKLENCYNLGAITSTGNLSQVAYNVGGIVGSGNSSGIELKNCYNAGKISGVRNKGGLISSVGNRAPIIAANSFFDIDLSGVETTAGGVGTGHNTEDMRKRPIYTDWDFVNTWIHSGNGYHPILKWQLDKLKPFTVTGKVIDKDGNPFTQGTVKSKFIGFPTQSSTIANDGTFKLENIPTFMHSIVVESTDPNYINTYY